MSDAKKEVLIIGGGVIGLSAAWYLCKAGHSVRILERDESFGRSCSEGNAGMIVPSHFVPLAAPGVIGQGLKWMLNPKSPFFLRPRLDPALARWVFLFTRHANARHVAKCEPLLRDLSLESRRLHLELAEREGFKLHQQGLLMLCQSEGGLEEESEVAERARELGLEAEVCDTGRVRELEPNASIDALGAVWWPHDCHLTPRDFLSGLRKGISRMGGEFLEEDAIGISVDLKSNRVSEVTTASGKKLASEFTVVAGGIDSTALLKPLGLKLPMQGGKGYSVTLPDPVERPRLCSLLKEGRVAVTPVKDGVRVAGTMEICGRDLSVKKKRLQGIFESFTAFYPEFSIDDFIDLKPWVGLRPCTPDGLPYLGKSPRHGNLVITTGHAMMGLSLAPVSGKIVRNLIEGHQPQFDLDLLSPTRFG